jgi:hypothetical protein
MISSHRIPISTGRSYSSSRRILFFYHYDRKMISSFPALGFELSLERNRRGGAGEE